MAREMIKISVILPVYNTGQYLARVLQALRNQDYPSDQYEMIFVDNGSSDDSLEILRQQDDIVVLSESERGSYAARNRGIAHARGNILAFTDSDCFPDPGWLESIEAAFAKESTQLILGPRLSVGGSAWVRLLADYENTKTRLICQSQDPKVYYGYTNNMAFRRSVLEQMGPFSKRPRGSDTMYVHQVAMTLTCEVIRYCPEMIVEHGELNSIGVYFSKMKTYGRSRSAHQHIMPVRSLKSAERWRIFRQCARDLNWIKTLGLFLLLSVGAVFWYWGVSGIGRQRLK